MVPCVNNIQFGSCSATNLNSQTFFLAGLGRTAPDPSAAVTLDGVQVPLGKGAHTNIEDTSLLYNEYPLTLMAWFRSLMILLPNDPTFFLLCCVFDYVTVQSQGQYMLFWILNKRTQVKSVAANL